MKVIVGLGNPGLKYKKTRHNVGFEAIDELASMLTVKVDKPKWQSLITETRVKAEKVLLVKPQTFMNLSGNAVSEIFHFYREQMTEKDLIVIYDDMDFPVGDLRLREHGSAGGHNGIKSIIQSIGTSDFPRARIGIGRPEEDRTVIDHVLTPFRREDARVIDGVVKRAAEAVLFAVENDFSLAMNRFNGIVDNS